MDEFRISNYLKPAEKQYTPPRQNDKYGTVECRMAKEWSKEAMRTIIYPTNSLAELDKLWIDFNCMPKDDRMESDDKSNEIFGVTNQENYEMLRSQLIKDDIKEIKIDNYIESAMESDGIFYTPVDVEAAIDWSKRSGYPIIFPTRNLEELEALWNNFLSYPIRIRNDSDTESIRCFGIDNERHYQYLRSEFLKDDIETEDIMQESFIGDAIISHKTFAMNSEVDTATRAKDLLTLVARKNENYEDAIISNIVDTTTAEYKASYQNLKFDVIPFADLPFFTPEEMIDFGVNQANPEDNFYGCEPIISNIITENGGNWFEQFSNACMGYYGSYSPLTWKRAIHDLYLKMQIAEDKDPYKQAILNLGWPPEAEFSPENQVNAAKRLKAKLADKSGSTQIVDLTGIDAEDISESAAISIDEDSTLYPVYLVLMAGNSLFSAAIKTVTKSKFSHAAISFDPTLKTMWSYGIEGSQKGMIGGFIKESIDNKPKDQEIAVYAIFLKKPDYEKLKNNVEFFIKNIGKTSYSYINLIVSHIFKIPMDMDRKMVCSQFVDKVLKLADIDISRKNSSLVAPSDIEKYAQENKKIYALYDNIVSKFKASRIKALVNKLRKKADPIKESRINWTDPVGIVFEMINNIHSLDSLQEISTKITLESVDPRVSKIYEVMVAPCLNAEAYFNEAKELPVKLDKEGNLFIKNIMKKKDFEAEYAKSHKLLRKYEENNNIEGIKYELCKLWSMNIIIEGRLYSDDEKYTKTNREVDLKARSKILNDFNYFLGVVLKKESDFNFEEYYNNSPFNDAMIKINKETIEWSGKLFKSLLLNFI